MPISLNLVEILNCIQEIFVLQSCYWGFCMWLN